MGSGGEREIKIRVSADTGDVETKLGSVEKSLAGVGQAGASVAPAAAALDKVGDAAAAAVPEQKALADALSDVTEHTKKLENAGDSMGALVRGTTKTKVAMDDLAQAEEKARAAGVKVGPEIAAAMTKADQATGNAIKRAAELRDQQEKTNTAIANAKNSVQDYAHSMTSLDGILGRMEQSNSKTAKGFANTGIAALGAVAGITMAVQAGKQLGEAIDWLAKKHEDWATKSDAASLKQLQLRNAMRLVEQGVIAQGKTVDETLANWTRYAESQGRAGDALAAFLKDLDKLGHAESFADLAKQADGLAVAMAGMLKKSLGETQQYLPLFQKAVSEVIHNFNVLGQEAPPNWLKVQKAIEQTLNAQKLLTAEGSKGLIERMARIKETADAEIRAAQQTAAAAHQSVEEKLRDLNHASLGEADYMAAKEQLRREDAKATAEAIAAEAEANKTREQGEGKVRSQLDLTKKSWDEVAKAVEDYATKVQAGVPAYAALDEAAATLRRGIADSRQAIVNYGSDVKRIMDSFVIVSETTAKKVEKPFSDMALSIIGAQQATAALAGTLVKFPVDAFLAAVAKIEAGADRIKVAMEKATGGGAGPHVPGGLPIGGAPPAGPQVGAP